MKKINITLLFLSLLCNKLVFSSQQAGGQPLSRQQRRLAATAAAKGQVVTPPSQQTAVMTSTPVTQQMTQQTSVPGQLSRAERRKQGLSGQLSIQQTTQQTYAPTATVITPQTPAKTQQGSVQTIKVDDFVWQSLSEDQRKAFNRLRPLLIEIALSKPGSRNYDVWYNKLIVRAKDIIDIDRSLLDYCIAVVEMAIDNLPEGLAVNSDLEKDEAQQELETYIPEFLLTTGSEKEQLDRLMSYIPLGDSKLPTKEWMNAVFERAKSLIVAKNALSIDTFRQSLMQALRKVRAINQQGVLRLVDGLVAKINEHKQGAILQSTPENINNRFQQLLLAVGSEGAWNINTNQPTALWVQAIVPVAKDMMRAFGITLDDIVQPISAQLFFIALTKQGGPLNVTQSNSLMSLIQNIKQQIGS